MKPRDPARARVPVELRLEVRAVDIADWLAADNGASSRTALIRRALRAHLDGSRPSD